MIVEIGDKIRISVELLRDLYDMPDHSSPVVEVSAIQEYDGVKIITLNKIGHARVIG